MPSGKNQHFVPQFYLRRFGGEGANHIGLYHLPTMRFVPKASIRQQSARPYFYGEDLVVEKLLAGFDDIHASALRDLAANPERVRSDEIHRWHLLGFLILQWMRTAARKREMEASVQGLMAYAPEFQDGVGREIIEKLELRFSHWATGAMHALLMLPTVLDLQIKTLRAAAPVFITSDNPVILQNRFLDERKRDGKGLASVGVQLLCPVDPRTVLLAYDGATYRVGSAGSSRATVSKRDVEKLNELQVLNAFDTLYVPPSLDEVGLAKVLAVGSRRVPLNPTVTEFHETRAGSRMFAARRHAEVASEGSTLIKVQPAERHPHSALSCVEVHPQARRMRLDNVLAAIRNPRRCDAHLAVVRRRRDDVFNGRMSVLDFLEEALRAMAAAS